MVRLPPKVTSCWLPCVQSIAIVAPSVKDFSVVTIAPFAPTEIAAHGVELATPNFVSTIKLPKPDGVPEGQPLVLPEPPVQTQRLLLLKSASLPLG